MLKRIVKDPAIFLLLAINLGLAMAYFNNIITAETIIFSYYFQSVLIGASYFFQIITLKDYSVENMMVNNKPLEKSAKTRGCVGIFFLLHYGFFHLVYFIFLVAFIGINGRADFHFILSSAIAFALGEIISVIRHRILFRNEKPNIGTMMFTPYLRIIPMHLFIIVGGFTGHQNPKVFALFIILKIVSDTIMHIVVNKTFKERQKEIQPPIIQI
jgi:hypothetical protein